MRIRISLIQLIIYLGLKTIFSSAAIPYETYLKTKNLELNENEKLSFFARSLISNHIFPQEQQEETERDLKSIRKYKLMNAEQIKHNLYELEKLYPDMVKVYTAQELYGFPSLGEKDDCPFDHDAMNDPSLEEDKIGCKTYILVIQDNVAHPFGSASYNHLPEVFLSGALHGDERVGPTAVMELATLLLEAAHCESLPRGKEPDKMQGKIVGNEKDRVSAKWTEWEKELKEARTCRRKLRNRSIYDSDRQWLARLATTRSIVILPTANALGFYRKERKEDGLDPKDDFPFDRSSSADTDAGECMQTIAARTVNELYRTHLFQAAISFHTGSVMVGYPYGAPNLLRINNPDEQALRHIAQTMADFAGHFKWKMDDYPVGAINDLMGPHHGRFEDWSYSGSWVVDKDMVPQCNPFTYGGYDASNTVYSDSMLRSLSIMIETSADHAPERDHLGSSYGIMNPISPMTGHIARNMRAGLAILDLVQPYAYITHVNGIALQDDIVPRSYRAARSCKQSKQITIPQGTQFITIEWYIGGGFTVDATSIMYGKWSDFPDEYDGDLQPPAELIAQFYREMDGDESKVIKEAPGGRGKTRWSVNAHPNLLGPNFSAAFDSFDFQEGDEIAVFVVVQMDKKWLNNIGNNELPPQSHVVNARTNPTWYHENNNKIVQGRLQWFSIPVTIVIGPKKSFTKESSMRIVKKIWTDEEKEEVLDISLMMIGFLLTITVLAGVNYYKWREQQKENQSELDRKSTFGNRLFRRPYAKVFETAEDDIKDDDFEDYEKIQKKEEISKLELM